VTVKGQPAVLNSMNYQANKGWRGTYTVPVRWLHGCTDRGEREVHLKLPKKDRKEEVSIIFVRGHGRRSNINCGFPFGEKRLLGVKLGGSRLQFPKTWREEKKGGEGCRGATRKEESCCSY